MKRRKSELKYRLEIVWRAKDDCYVVNVPELPGCMTHGDSIEEALKNAYEAVGVYVESLRKRRLPIPTPLSEKKFSGKIPLRIDPNLHRDLAVQAEIEGVSVNKLIETRLKKGA